MRLTSRVLARSWLVLAAAVVTTLPTAAVAATPAPPPHAVGGVIPSAGRTSAASTLGSASGASASEVLPAGVDMRDYAPAVGDQGQIGACVAWTIGYSIMGYWANRSGGVGDPYAPLFLYMRNVAKNGAPTAGLNPDAVLANAASAGVDTQDDYWQGTTNWQAAPTQAEIDNARSYTVSGWNRLFVGNNQGAAAQTAIMTTLASGSPVALALPVFRDFMYLKTHTLYNTLSGTNLGGHMVAVYGYDAQGVFIRNSWGSGWGNGGDAHLSWAFITKVASGAYAVNGISTPASPVALAPTVGTLSTIKAAAGTSVTISGAGLSTATSVRFGSNEADFTAQTSNGMTKLVAVAPAHATGVVDVTVTNPAGTSTPSTVSKFTYIPPAPGITTLTPSTVSILGGTTVTVTGTDLTGSSVKLGTTPVAAKVISPTSLTFVAPLAKAAGTVAVTVSTMYGVSNPAGQLTYELPPTPVITSVTPSSGLSYKTTPVTVTGTDFGGATKVTLGGVPVPFTKVSATQLKLTLPVKPAGDLGLQITTPGGTSTVDTAATFTYLAPPAPAITSITPNSGLTSVKTPVVINGVNFTDSTKLTVGGVSLPYTKVSATQIRTTLPTHAAGAVDVQLTTPGGVTATGSDAQFTFTAPPVPVVSALDPASGLSYLAKTVVLTGTDFTGATKVTAGGVTVPFTKVSGTQIRVMLPARSAPGDVALVVTTPGGPSAAATYTATAAPVPVITSLSVTTAVTRKATLVTITGTGLTAATKLTVGGVTTLFSKVSDTQLKVTVPARTVAGAAPIVVTTPGGASEPADFSFVSPAAFSGGQQGP